GDMSRASGRQSAASNSAQVVGLLLACILYFPLGVAGLLIINAASFVVILVALGLMRPIPPTSAPSHSIIASVGAGFGYLRGHPRAKWLLALTATALFGAGSFAALFPGV